MKERIQMKFWSEFSSFLVFKRIIFSSILKEDCSSAGHMINQDFFNASVEHSDSKIIYLTSSWNWNLTLLLKIKSNLNRLWWLLGGLNVKSGWHVHLFGSIFWLSDWFIFYPYNLHLNFVITNLFKIKFSLTIIV